MGKEILRNKHPHCNKATSPGGSLSIFDLPVLIESMKQSRSWGNGDLNAMILLKSPDKQIVLTILHEGTEVNSFQSNDSVTFQIIEGSLMFQARKESVKLDKGQILTLDENIRYCLTTIEETAFLLTIAMGNSLKAEN